MLNQIVLIGRLTADPELRYTTNGTAVASFNMAVDRSHSEETDFIPIVVWGKNAETVAQYLKKGRLVAVDGELRRRSYDHKEYPIKVYVSEVHTSFVRFLDKNPEAQQLVGVGNVANAAAPAPTASGQGFVNPFLTNAPGQAPAPQQPMFGEQPALGNPNEVPFGA